MSKQLTRREIRIKAVQALFQLFDSNQETSADDAITFALFAGDDPDVAKVAEAPEYLKQLVEGVVEHQTEIDAVIDKYLTNWTLDRLALIDLAILRLAIYEMDYVDDELVPRTVAVDEAIDLSKGFSNEKSRQFVSGLLLKYLNEK